ncbi:hypothetical protein GA0070563_101719 [Micromonospora carbonacea]|uniref:Uncharacterized protein n=1 Tax=Micromonospora carbonacea TaxID=47853 RepID=A0A1C4USC9_9ACTN|nr:hypothetical protein GA0070563_101719 [Micromonospora carbonacea]
MEIDIDAFLLIAGPGERWGGRAVGWFGCWGGVSVGVGVGGP